MSVINNWKHIAKIIWPTGLRGNPGEKINIYQVFSLGVQIDQRPKYLRDETLESFGWCLAASATLTLGRCIRARPLADRPYSQNDQHNQKDDEHNVIRLRSHFVYSLTHLYRTCKNLNEKINPRVFYPAAGSPRQRRKLLRNRGLKIARIGRPEPRKIQRKKYRLYIQSMDGQKKIGLVLLLLVLVIVYIAYRSESSKEGYEVGIIINGKGLRRFPLYYESLRLPESEKQPKTMSTRI